MLSLSQRTAKHATMYVEKMTNFCQKCVVCNMVFFMYMRFNVTYKLQQETNFMTLTTVRKKIVLPTIFITGILRGLLHAYAIGLASFGAVFTLQRKNSA